MQSYKDKADDYFAHARRGITPLLPRECARVLEIGCGSGATLGWLRQSRRASHTVGVEIAEAAAESATAHADVVHCLDFEHSDLPAGTGGFDVILCLDVLEHMVDPWSVVDRLVRTHLVSGGMLVVSLPNVRHHSVVLPLLFKGQWRYETAGLLDRTHLRFFTRGTALGLLAHPMLGPARLMAEGFDWPSPKAIFNSLTAGVFRELLTYQYYLAACKKA